MESLQIKTGQISLQILDDSGNERGIFTFNPTDVRSAKAMVELKEEFNQKQPEFEKKIETAETDVAKVDVLNECVDYFEGLIDSCFGEGSSIILFGNNKSLDMFVDFFEGITPYYEKASKERMAKYGVVEGKKK